MLQKIRSQLLLGATAALLAITGLQAADIPGFGGEPSKILSVDEAFVLSAAEIEGDQLSVEFALQPGYYLYRKKMDIQAIDAALIINSVQKPKGQLTSDEFFGETQIYRDAVTVTAAWSGTAQNSQIRVLYQGCADLGICYPPQEKILKLSDTTPTGAQKLTKADITQGASAASPVGAGSGLGKSTGISALLSNDNEELLPPDIAFIPSVSPQQGDSLKVRFVVEDGYYLYKDKISATLSNAAGGNIASIDLPAGKEKDDAYFGMVEVYRHAVEASLALQGIEKDTAAELSLNYQGCADIGVCFPPQTTVLPVNLLATAAVSQSMPGSTTGSGPDSGSTGTGTPQGITGEPAGGAEPAGQVAATRAGQTAGIEDTLLAGNLWLIIVTFFGLGLLLAFTPCVLPMVPILSSLIVGQGESATTRNSFLLSLTYVLAMAVTYTIAGVIVGLSGENIQIWFQNPWVLSAFALLFVLLSLSMFGFYELQMPPAIQQKLNNMSNSAQGGTYIGAGIMGFLSALVVGPCVTAPLVGALIFIADTGDAVLGGAALFALAMGMGAPLLLIGASCGKLLPKAGAWMETTKAVFGVLMLGLAIWMLSRFIPAPATLALYAALLIVSGIYLGATDSLNSDTTGWQRLFKGVGIVVLVYGMTLLIGAVSGGHSLLQPLSGIMASNAGSNGKSTSHELEFKRVASISELDSEVALAASRGQTVMLDFYADWCISCKEMEAFTFTDSEVQALLKNTLLLQADVTANNGDDKALLKRFGLFGPPGIIFYQENGQEIQQAKLVGFMAADKFAAHLDKYF